jgi:hypothetical protein
MTLLPRYVDNPSPMTLPPRYINQSNTAGLRHPKALTAIETNSTILAHLHQAVQEELRTIAAAIISRAAAPTWSLEQGILFFGGCFYLPAASPLLSKLLQSLQMTT